jgi:hypothetical protein
MKNVYTLDQIIYITSDEEIKEGDWVVTPNKTIMLVTTKYTTESSFMIGDSKHKGSPYYIEFCRKIILTTDPLLDGVQKIDDEFLEWFVKNPNCEEVEVRYEVLKPFQSIDKGYILRLPDTDVLEVPNLTDEKGRPMTYWGGLAEPSQKTLEEADYEKLKQSLIEFRKIPITFVPDERMYSEEEVLDILRKSHSIEQTSKMDSWITKWFEQFKKK